VNVNAFETVVMPDRIQKLPRDRRGFPVPYVADWSDRDVGPPARRRHIVLPGFDWEGFAPAAYDVIGEDNPRLGKVAMDRQLIAHERPLCNVCGQIIGERLHFVGGWCDPQTYTEAPLHRECARYSLLVCPGLAVPRFDPHKQLSVTIVRRSTLTYLGQFITASSHGASVMMGDAEARRHAGPIGLLDVIAIMPPLGQGARRLDSEAWLAEDAR
jgi:hypothetical protein